MTLPGKHEKKTVTPREVPERERQEERKIRTEPMPDLPAPSEPERIPQTTPSEEPLVPA